MTDRKLPNILIAGTPGVGKSTLCYELMKQTNFKWLEIGKIAKENQFYKGYDSKYECPVLDEDKLLDELEGCVASGDNIVDYHSTELFPERWFDAVYVLRADTKYLFLLDELEGRVASGGNIVDYHSTELFPERWFDAVYVLRADTKYLFDRLKARGYSGKKFEDNIQCEIFQTVLEEARESYRLEIVKELRSDTHDDMSANLTTIINWIQEWKKEHQTH